jgi:hypothetical protein
MDPHLNYLFDSQQSAEHLVNSIILPLSQEQIIKIYIKLTSLKHSITKNMQKEIEAKHQTI